MRGRWAGVARILDVALELTPEQRAAFLDQACVGDPELRTEIDVMLARAGANGFLKEGKREAAGKYQALLTGGIERAGSASQAP